MRAAASVALLALTAGCGGGGGSSPGGTTPATVQPTGETPAPTGSPGSNPSSIATLFPGSKGNTTVAKAMVPATPLGGQSNKTVLLAAHTTPSGNSTGTSNEAVTGAGTTIGTVHLSAGSFSVVDNPCTGRTLQPGDTCVITVAFSPTTTGSHTAELTVDTSAADADYRVELIGEGVASGSPSPSSPSSPSPHSKSPTPGTTPPPGTMSSPEAPSGEATAS
ncbi:hypothetical protein ACFVUY_10060 [Kitasatospora sp. NPDC058063]|uniref:hypothetical protein n=1 Tax=unclassified Kitasatospora TaxID=2633591 RepID=UPI0036DB1A83